MTLGDCLLWSKSVALVGASDDPSKTTGRTLQYLRRSGFAGKVYPINPRRETVMGTKAWPSVESLPETPDHAFIMVPTADVAAAVADCVRRSIPLVTVLASGYSEKGSEGRSREEELRHLLRGGRTRLLGPNSIGVVNMRSGLRLTVNAAFAATDQSTTGGVFVASHSGSMIGALLSRGQARGLGFAGFVSSGSETDLSLGELCAATLDDPGIRVYALFLESIRNGNTLRRFLVEAAKRGKPVVAYKLGRSAQAAELSQSHTGAIAGEDAVADTMLKDSGVARVNTLDGLIVGPPFLQRLGTRIRESPKVAVVSTTGGAAAMIVGCSVLLKPSEATPACALMIGEAMQESGLPAGVLNIVFGEPAAIGSRLATDTALRALTFTGSTQVGKQLASRASATLKKLVLELGGHAPVLVFDDVDVASVAQAVVAAKFRNSGQVCTSPTRVWVQEKIYQEFGDCFTQALLRLRPDDPFDPLSSMGPLQNRRRVEAIQALVADATRNGARAIVGTSPVGRGYWYAPTLLVDVPAGACVLHEEPFGPVAVLGRFASVDQAIAEANRLPLGLAAYGFTRDLAIAEHLTTEIRAGTLAINHLAASFPETPFGGVKDSGLGTEGGHEGVAAFTQTRFVSVAT